MKYLYGHYKKIYYMNKIGIFLFFFLLSTVGLSQPEDYVIDKSGTVNPWSHLSFNNNSNNFQFAIISDRTGGNRPGVYEEGIAKLNLLQPEFVMSVGDNIEGYTTDKTKLDKEWIEFKNIIEGLQMPFFFLAGNHDFLNQVQADKWNEHLGRSYYHFIYRNVLFLCLNTEEAMLGSNRGGIEKPQFDYFRTVLQKNKNVRWTMVFMHQPLWNQDSTRYWPEIEKMLSERNHTVIAGHKHTFSKSKRNNGEYYVLATTGGFSKLRGPDAGEYDHLLWVTMTKEGPVIANLKLDGIITESR
jgi:3',5'-cyclic AMP phosphodiesterase CpdA